MSVSIKGLILTSFLLACVVLVASTAQAAPPSPFVGHWKATDAFDESTIRLTIAGGGRGIYNLSWIDDFWEFCDGDPGLGKGRGSLRSDDPNVLEADLVFRCLTKDKTQAPQVDFFYDSLNDEITNTFETWTRVGQP